MSLYNNKCFEVEYNETLRLLSFQVSMRPMAGERRGRRQFGKSSHWSAGVTWWRGGCWKVDRDASRAGLSFSECAGSAGVAWQPKQCVLTKNTFFSIIADLLVGTITDYAPVFTFLFNSCPLPLMFVFIHPHYVSICLVYFIRNALC